MTVCSVVVTYGNRHALLSQVVNALFTEGTDELVIVNNGSAAESRLQIGELEKRYHPRLTVYDFPENKGSAPGFHKGLEVALTRSADFVWMMDDDNKPATGALSVLKDFWQQEVPSGEQDITALCSLRKSRPNFMDAIEYNNPDLILQTKNNFAGFHLKTLFSKIKERLVKSGDKKMPNTSFLKINATCYGGLFFHKDFLKRYGLPDEEYVLYADDFAYTYRITQLGGKILLVPASMVEDIESSFYLPKKKKLLYHSVFDGGSDTTVYYSFRNSIYFSDKYLMTNRGIRYLNKMTFLALITGIGVLRGETHRLRILKEAIRDAEKGKLGERAGYKL